jgi:methylisocitrate lyase
VARSVDIPVYCDADTGYGGPVNVQRTVAEFVHAGVAGVHIEDQKEPKKAGGQPGIALVSDEEAIGRLNAACDARDRHDSDFVIVARTDGYGAAGGSVEEAIRRGLLYQQETGADVIFYEGFHTWEQVREALAETPGPAYAIPSLDMDHRPTMDELSAMGQAIEILPFVLPGVHETWRLLRETASAGDYGPMDRYFARMADARGTENDVGWGDVFGRPSYADARTLEERFLPKAQQRDYANNVNATGAR